jgi:hypothetical protein
MDTLEQRAEHFIVDRQAHADLLRSIPDHRPFEDGTRLNLEMRIEGAEAEAQLVRDLLSALQDVRAEGRRETKDELLPGSTVPNGL